MVNDVTLNFYG